MTNKRRKMEIILNERRKGKSRPDCAMAASIPLQRIVHWYNEGKQYIGEDNIYFYKSLKKIEKELDEKSKYVKDIKEFNSKGNSLKRKDFLNYINMGKTRKNACKFAEINLKLIIRWDSLGRQGIKPFKSFYDEYTIELFEEVSMMTPENIHINSFMFEPILDMDDYYLKKLYNDLLNLDRGN